jgi:hypothetical protein
MALGAQIAGVQRLIIRQGMRLASIGVMLGLAAAGGGQALQRISLWSSIARPGDLHRRAAVPRGRHILGVLDSLVTSGSRGSADGSALRINHGSTNHTSSKQRVGSSHHARRATLFLFNDLCEKAFLRPSAFSTVGIDKARLHFLLLPSPVDLVRE